MYSITRCRQKLISIALKLFAVISLPAVVDVAEVVERIVVESELFSTCPALRVASEFTTVGKTGSDGREGTAAKCTVVIAFVVASKSPLLLFGRLERRLFSFPIEPLGACGSGRMTG
jgi:hypothetical protein